MSENGDGFLRPSSSTSPLSKNEYPARIETKHQLAWIPRTKNQELTQSHVIFIKRKVYTIDRSSCLRVSQNTQMVNERCWVFIRRPVQLNEYPLDIIQVSLECIQEAACLQVFRGCTPNVKHQQQRIQTVKQHHTQRSRPL